MSVGDTESVAAQSAASHITPMWFLKRLILAVAILVVSFGGLAWLTHAAIDPGTPSGPESLLEVIGRLAANF